MPVVMPVPANYTSRYMKVCRWRELTASPDFWGD